MILSTNKLSNYRKNTMRLGMSGFFVLAFTVFGACESGAQTETLAPASERVVLSPQPDEIVRPFNGKDFSGLTTWLKESGTDDPDGVYSAVDGTLRISGEGFGYVGTKENYENYHFSVEYRWGKKTDGSGYVRNSGILLHANGPEGNAKGMWMASVECQLAQGCEGDLIVIAGNDKSGKALPVTLASNTVVVDDGKTRWKLDGQKTEYTGKQFWWSGHQVKFAELVDTRGIEDVASPLGEWTRVDCICSGDRITIKINGITVNECYNVSPSSGRILLENEDNEIFFRNWELRPLPDSNKAQ